MNWKSVNFLLIVDDIHLGGGGERVAVNMANHYYNQGCHVEFVSFKNPQSIPPFNLASDIRINYLNVSGNKLSQKILAYKRLRSFLCNNKFKYVIAIGSHPSTILGFIKYKDGFTIGTEHSHYYHAPKIWNILRNFAYRRLSAITVLTNDDFPILNKINRCTRVIPNSIASFPTSYASMDNKNIIAVGRMDQFKQFDKLIDIFKKVVEINADWKLTIVGEGEMRESLAHQISILGLGENIELKPFNPLIGEEYSKASILVSTSNKEGLPMVMIEAQSYGLPIVSYDCKTGPKDIVIDGRNGYLVKLNDEEAMVNSLVKLTGNYELRLKMSKNAIIDASRFSPEVVYEKWDNLFSSLKFN